MSHIFPSSDIASFTVTKGYPVKTCFENGFIRKIYNKDNWLLNENGDLIVSFFPEETRYISPGKYFYEVKVDLEGKGEWMLVFNEVKLYDTARETYKDFAMKKVDYLNVYFLMF